MLRVQRPRDLSRDGARVLDVLPFVENDGQPARWRQGFADAGLRAANARDPKFMAVLGKAAEIVTKMDEEQRGFSRRFAEKESERRETTETQMWREAFRCADEGYPQPELAWIYGAAAWLCGYYA